jgi:nucleotide-binding universal stress UspA family protein
MIQDAGAQPGGRKEEMVRILMYYDGTEYTKDALPLVKTHAKAFHATVDIVSSLHKGGESQLDEIEEREAGLDYLKSALAQDEIAAESHLLIKGNNAGDDVLSFAEEHHVDEIIIGTQKKSRVEKFILGSVAQHVIMNAHCPVVIL